MIYKFYNILNFVFLRASNIKYIQLFNYIL